MSKNKSGLFYLKITCYFAFLVVLVNQTIFYAEAEGIPYPSSVYLSEPHATNLKFLSNTVDYNSKSPKIVSSDSQAYASSFIPSSPNFNPVQPSKFPIDILNDLNLSLENINTPLSAQYYSFGSSSLSEKAGL